MPVTPPVFVQAAGPAETFFADTAAITGGMTIGSQPNNILIIEGSYDSGTPQTPLVDGSTAGVVLLTSQLNPAPSAGVGVNIYYKLNVAAGTHSLSFKSTGGSIVTIFARLYKDVNQVTPFGTPVKTNGSSATTLTITVPTAVGDLVIDAVQWRSGGSINRVAAVGASQTARANYTGYSDGRGSSEETAAGTSTVMSWTLTATGTPVATPVWAQIAVVLNGFNDIQSAVLNAAGIGAAEFVGRWSVPAALVAAGVGTATFVGMDAAPPPQRNYMSKGNTFETEVLLLFFNAVSIPNLAQNGTSPLANLFCALHTADPGEAGDQTTNETAYTGYARQTIPRSAAGFVVAGSGVSPFADVTFPVCTAAPGTTLTHASFGVAVSGASKILYSGPITPQIAIAVGVIPRLTTASLVTEE